MDQQRAVFLLIFLVFFVLAPDQTPRRRFRFIDENLDQERQHDFDILANSTYGELTRDGLNLTGFGLDDGYRWDLLSVVQDRSRLQLANARHDTNSAETPAYRELTGEVRGKFAQIPWTDTPHHPINLTTLDPQKEYLTDFWSRNVTEREGEVVINLHDKDGPPGKAKIIEAEISLWTDSAPGNGWLFSLRGVHGPDGGIVMTSYSSKFNALPALPQFELTEKGADMSKTVVNKTIAEVWHRKMMQDPDIIGIPSCELVVWLQPKPLTGSQLYLDRVEQELLHPEGAPLGEALPMSFSGVFFSPDCGYMLETETLFGPKIEAYTRLAGRFITGFILTLLLQIALLKRQMEKASTPSTRNRISYQGIVIAGLGDGLVLFGMIAMLMLDTVNFLVVATCTFASCIHVAFLEVKFVFDIWTVQVADPARAEHDRQRRSRPAQTVPPTTSPTPADVPTGLPLPATTPRTDGATPIIIQSDGELDQPPSDRASFAAIYSRFYFTLVCLVFFSMWTVTWPRPLRSGFANMLAFGYFSLWWPQVYRNTMRNCRKALSWEYVVGTTLLRTLPVLHWYLADNNLLSIDTSPSTAYLLLGWIWLQVAVLAIQQLLGPRLLVKDSWCPSAYDYHPILQEDDVEGGGMSIGLLASASEAKDKDDKTRKIFDCAICMNEIDVPVVSKEQKRGSAWLEQSLYMVTPCRHIFHAECLEGWMNLRLVCPVCRESLPPL